MTQRRRRRRQGCLAFMILPFLGLLVALLLAGWALLRVPAQVTETFGPPSPNLGLQQRLYYSFVLFIHTNDLAYPVQPGGPEKSFEITPGESVPAIAQKLYQQRLIPNPDAFRTYLLYSGLDTRIQSGSYSLSPSLSPIEIAQSLQDATPKQVTFNILPGWRLEEIAAGLPTSGLSISPDEFLAAAAVQPAGYSFSSDLPPGSTLEGFLLPGAYVFDRDTSTTIFITTLLDNFESQVGPDLRAGYSRQGLSLFQAVTLASLIEREAMVDPDMPLIASVFYNRLAINMKLDSDPTVQYAIGYNERQQTWWTNPLSLNDLQFPSPYNTYLYRNFPPGPIAAPTLPALQAAAYPASTPYYYFRAGCDNTGRHLFAETFQEHLTNACP
jgi:UPF0755 protein